MPKSFKMKLDVVGRIRNTSVPHGHGFLPLFEAVINSIHAAEDRFADAVAAKGRIEVVIERTAPRALLPGMAGRPPVAKILSITITDNGCGFTDENLESFATADSTAKAHLGGKGVGRFTWLVVFNEASIVSTVDISEGKREKRSFKFLPNNKGIQDYTTQPTSDPVATTITLSGIKKQYAEVLRMGGEAIADRLFEHCFNYFVLGRCPKITLRDETPDEEIRIDLNARMADVECSAPTPLEVGDHALEVLHVERKFAAGRKHEAHLCANRRVVESFGLTDYCGLNPEPYRNSSGENVVQHAFVSGRALDEAVDATRTRLNLPDGDPLFAGAGALDLARLRKQLGAHVDEHLADVLRTEREENLTKVQAHIRTVQPEYRHLLTRSSEALARLRWTDDKSKLDERLYQVAQAHELEVRQRLRAVEESLSGQDADLDQLADELTRVITEVNEQGQANLVRYVAKRRAVLRLLRKLVSVTSGPALEEHVHRVVFPLRKSADDVAYDEHNLWLVDDTLSFYEFVSSDKSLSQIAEAPADSPCRPDVLAFKAGDPYVHVAIVEFKRADREDENPVEQLVKYALLLRDGGAKNAHGITMTGIAKSVRIDAYAVCTLTPKLEQLIRGGPGNMAKVAEEGRWYGFNSGENLWLEVLDFQAFIRRAEQRNRAFFTKLGLH